jgi:hypothetical protein
MLNVIKKILESPYTNLLMGVILFICGLSEALEVLSEDLEHFSLRVHHGIMVFGLFTILKTFPDIFESLEHIHKGVKKHRNGSKKDNC